MAGRHFNCAWKENVDFPLRHTFTSIKRSPIVRMKWKSVVLKWVSHQVENGRPAVTKWLPSWKELPLSPLTFSPETEERLAEMKWHTRKNFYSLKGAQEQFPVRVMREIILCKAVCYISVGRELPGDVPPQKYQPIWQPFHSVWKKKKNASDPRRKISRKIRLCTPLSFENSSSKERRFMGIVSGCYSEWIQGKEQRFKGQSEGKWGGQTGSIWSHRLLCGYSRAKAPQPRQARDIQGLFPPWHSSDIFYGDFIFPCPSTRILFPLEKVMG